MHWFIPPSPHMYLLRAHCILGGILRGWDVQCIKDRALGFYSMSVSQFSLSVVSNSLKLRGLQHVALPCPSLSPGVCSNSCPSSQWWHPTISSCCPLLLLPSIFPASGSFQISQFFASGGQSIGASASTSVLPMNIQDWFPLGWTGWISLQSKGL